MGSRNVDYSSSFLLYLFFIIFSSVVQSLHLKMMHRDSIHSPLYPGNLTHEERLQRLYDYAESSAQFYSTKLTQSAAQGIAQVRPRVNRAKGHVYMVEVTIGTPVRGKYNLFMDTGSNLVWLQCQPCRRCWEQITPYFNPQQQSKSYAPLPCNHPLCNLQSTGWQCINNQCHYTLRYVHPATSKGFMGTETFGFASNSRWSRRESIKGLVFGCGNDNEGFPGDTNVAGFLGLDSNKLSFAKQLTVATHFAYCLQPYLRTVESSSLLRFGREAILRGANVKTIPFVAVPGSDDYYLDLVDISVAARRIGFPAGTFAVRNRDGSHQGGFMIDSGTSMTIFMKGGPYETIVDAFNAYLRSFNLRPDPRALSNQHCYLYGASEFRAYPSMTFHFNGGVDFAVQQENMVYRYQTGFCVMIKGIDGLSILGAYQQQNHRISYDLVNRKLSFVPADCLRDG